MLRIQFAPTDVGGYTASENALVQGWSFFSHPEWTNRRFYPLRSP